DERHRHPRREGAEPRIHDERAIVERYLQEHVRARRGAARREQYDTRRVRGEREAELAERGAEQGRLLEAVAAAALVHELRLQALDVEPDRTAEQHVYVLERDVAHVRVEDAGERVVGRARAPAPLDALEIGIEIEAHVVLR